MTTAKATHSGYATRCPPPRARFAVHREAAAHRSKHGRPEIVPWNRRLTRCGGSLVAAHHSTVAGHPDANRDDERRPGHSVHLDDAPDTGAAHNVSPEARGLRTTGDSEGSPLPPSPPPFLGRVWGYCVPLGSHDRPPRSGSSVALCRPLSPSNRQENHAASSLATVGPCAAVGLEHVGTVAPAWTHRFWSACAPRNRRPADAGAGLPQLGSDRVAAAALSRLSA